MDEKYPIGRFEFNEEITEPMIKNWILDIENLPILLKEAVKNLNKDQLNTPYRTGGWTVRQVIHHLADSHLNSFIRVKLALTEDKPMVKTYDEEKWAMLPDSEMDIDGSLALLEGLHKRWAHLLKSLKSDERKKSFMHPEMGQVSIERSIELYAWQGKHHLAHIKTLCKSMD